MKRIILKDLKNLKPLKIVPFILKDSDKKLSWLEQSRWIKANYKQTKILAVYKILLKAYRLNFDNDHLLVHLDIVWFAMEDLYKINFVNEILRFK